MGFDAERELPASSHDIEEERPLHPPSRPQCDAAIVTLSWRPVAALSLTLALVALGACKADQDPDPVTVGAIQEVCRSSGQPIRVLEASRSNLTSGEFELAGQYQIGFGGQGGIPAKIELKSADGSVAWSTSLSAVGAGLHCVSGGGAEGLHTMTVVPQLPSAEKSASWKLLVVVLPS